MKDQLSMFEPTTSEDTGSATSSPASGSGATPCGSPDGPTSSKSGPEAAPASRSPRPAGRAGGFDDGRHLWPHWSGLIGERRPGVVFGEQVASADGLAWLDFVCADLEGAGYAVGANDLCAAGFGAPHIRQRLFFVADAECRSTTTAGTRIGRRVASSRRRSESERQRLRDEPRDGGFACAVADHDKTGRGIERRPRLLDRERTAQRDDIDGCRKAGELADTEIIGCPEGRECEQDGAAIESLRQGDAGIVGDTAGAGCEGRSHVAGSVVQDRQREAAERHASVPSGPCNGFWRSAEWIPCRDGKARPVEPGTFPLVTGAPARVGRLRAYGNAIVAPVAAEFIGAYMNTRSSGDHGGVK
jgi:DNA (cytosine-5)-methyltransferase 1